jgi:hypothetical protein
MVDQTMTIVRLRPKYSEEILRAMYATPHDHMRWGRGHRERVLKMIELGKLKEPYDSIADLSCGNGYVIDNLSSQIKLKGDLAPGYPYTGMIEQTIHEISPVELFISGETLEHLDDPTAVLTQIRACCSMLLLSTPIENFEDTHAEHYWGWDQEGVESLMFGAGFNTRLAFARVDTRVYRDAYCYGVWMME